MKLSENPRRTQSTYQKRIAVELSKIGFKAEVPLDIRERFYDKKTFRNEADVATKRKIGTYLEEAGEEKINSITSNPEEAKKRFDRLYEDPSDPIGEGKFKDWTPGEIASLYYVLFGNQDIGPKIPLPPSHFDDDK